MGIFASYRHFTWRNLITTYLITLGQLSFGYPSSIISTTLGSPAFLEYMQLVDPVTGVVTQRANAIIGTTSGLFQAGAFVNCFITCYILEKFGRKQTGYYNSVIGLFGGALTTGAPNIGTFLAGRWFTGMSAWGFLILTPVYAADLSPPDVRGLFTGLCGVHIGLGYLLAACMGRAFATSVGEEQWRTPLGIYLLFPLSMIAIMFYCPESPRWLLLNEREDEAHDIVLKLHTVHGDEGFAKREFHQMKSQAVIDRTLDTSWVSMFKIPSYRRRTLICMFYAFCGQSTAILVINNYGPTFYKALGYNTIEQINFQVGWVSLAPFFGFIGAALLDGWGRKPLMLFGIGGCCLCLCIEAAAVANFVGHEERKGVGALGVAAFYLFIACYSIGVDVGGNVFYAEVFPNHIRHQGVAITNAVLALTDLVYLEITPVAFANIGYKFFLVFISISAIGFVILMFIIPETKGIPLEEMGKLFGDDLKTIKSEEEGDSTYGSQIRD